jgi:trimeric autotransporter adhesin
MINRKLSILAAAVTLALAAGAHAQTATDTQTARPVTSPPVTTPPDTIPPVGTQTDPMNRTSTSTTTMQQDRDTRGSAVSSVARDRQGSAGEHGDTVSRVAQSQQVFDQLDIDGDGYLARTDLPAEAELRNDFEQWDEDGDGRLSRSEFTAWVRDDGGEGLASLDAGAAADLDFDDFDDDDLSVSGTARTTADTSATDITTDITTGTTSGSASTSATRDDSDDDSASTLSSSTIDTTSSGISGSSVDATSSVDTTSSIGITGTTAGTDTSTSRTVGTTADTTGSSLSGTATTGTTVGTTAATTGTTTGTTTDSRLSTQTDRTTASSRIDSNLGTGTAATTTTTFPSTTATTATTGQAVSQFAQAQQLFDQLDEDNDGYLVRTEVPASIELNAEFDQWDTNDDTRISRLEFGEWVRTQDAAALAALRTEIGTGSGTGPSAVPRGQAVSQFAQQQQVFDQLDVNADGYLLISDLPAGSDLRSSFERWDSDSDNRLSRIEFGAWAQTQDRQALVELRRGSTTVTGTTARTTGAAAATDTFDTSTLGTESEFSTDTTRTGIDSDTDLDVDLDDDRASASLGSEVSTDTMGSTAGTTASTTTTTTGTTTGLTTGSTTSLSQSDVLETGIDSELQSFQELDTDGDGYLARTDLESGDELASRFDEFDLDNDGRLSRAEFDAWLASTDSGLGSGASTAMTTGSSLEQRSFTELDSNSDGFVYRSDVTVGTDLATRFDEYDLDRDGRLSRSEFESWTASRSTESDEFDALTQDDDDFDLDDEEF